MLGARENEHLLDQIEDTEGTWEQQPPPDEMSRTIEAADAKALDPETGMPFHPEDLTHGAKS